MHKFNQKTQQCLLCTFEDVAIAMGLLLSAYACLVLLFCA